jgi:D-xylose transport system permease protein
VSNDVIVEKESLGTVAHNYWSKVKSGDIGSLPAVLGLVALAAIFTVMSEFFFTNRNFANLLTQAAPVIVIAMGLVFVLLLGEIDLSAGYASGVTGAVLVLLITNHDFPWYAALPISIGVGAVLGLLMGTLVSRVGIPSFVVTLSAFLHSKESCYFLQVKAEQFRSTTMLFWLSKTATSHLLKVGFCTSAQEPFTFSWGSIVLIPDVVRD